MTVDAATFIHENPQTFLCFSTQKISAGTVDSRLHRARRQLRKKMAPLLAAEGRALEGGAK